MSSISKKIIIADTQYLVVETLRTILAGEDQITEVSVISSKYELTKTLERDSYILLITDPLLFDYKDFGDLKQLKHQFPKLSVLILTNSLGKEEVNELSKIGIKNIIYKTADRIEVLSAVDAALKGKKYFSEEVLDLILEQNESKSIPEEPTHLTNSEIEIVRLISCGLTTKEIASQKNISFHTVNTHRKNIFRKMGVTNASELIIQSIKAGWIDNIEYFI